MVLCAAPNSWHPFRRTSFPSFGGTTGAFLFRSYAVEHNDAGPRLIIRYLFRKLTVEMTGPPRFLGNPLCTCPAHRPRWDRGYQAIAVSRCSLPQSERRRLPQQKTISGLNHTACTLAVYASQPGLPLHHARLASDGRLTFSDGIGYPLGSNERFLLVTQGPPFPNFLAHSDFVLCFFSQLKTKNLTPLAR